MEHVINVSPYDLDLTTASAVGASRILDIFQEAKSVSLNEGSCNCNDFLAAPI